MKQSHTHAHKYSKTNTHTHFHTNTHTYCELMRVKHFRMDTRISLHICFYVYVLLTGQSVSGGLLSNLVWFMTHFKD